jgi:hypothetical protein
VIEYNSLTVATFALGLSLVSAALACWSAYSSHKSRKAAERSSEILRLRREEELAPRFEAWLQVRDGTPFLYLKNQGIVNYNSVVFNLEKADGLVGLPIRGLQLAGWGGHSKTGDLGLFEAGSTKILIAERDQLHPSPNFRLRLVCMEAGGRRWTTTVVGEMEPRLRE